MAYSERLAERIRKALGHLPVEEKKMFGGLAFMINGKMCLTVGPGRIMARIGPKLHQREVKRDGCSTVVMKGREYKSYVYIKEENLKSAPGLNHWISLALAFNRQLGTGGG